MRIVGGRLGGRRFPGPPGDVTRPTSERVREAVASALVSRGAIEGAIVLDLFAGTGALAFEAVSRGAASAVVVDDNARVCAALTESIGHLGLSAEASVLRLDLLRQPGHAAAIIAKALVKALPHPATLVFVDPPYAEAPNAMTLLAALIDAGLVDTGATIVFEHAIKSPPAVPPTLAIGATYRYGDTGVLLLRPVPRQPVSERQEIP